MRSFWSYSDTDSCNLLGESTCPTVYLLSSCRRHHRIRIVTDHILFGNDEYTLDYYPGDRFIDTNVFIAYFVMRDSLRRVSVLLSASFYTL